MITYKVTITHAKLTGIDELRIVDPMNERDELKETVWRAALGTTAGGDSLETAPDGPVRTL